MGSNPDISEKYKMGDISKGVAHTQHVARLKIKKNVFTHPPPPHFDKIYRLPQMSVSGGSFSVFITV
jgi:hypothetical protein